MTWAIVETKYYYEERVLVTGQIQYRYNAAAGWCTLSQEAMISRQKSREAEDRFVAAVVKATSGINSWI